VYELEGIIRWLHKYGGTIDNQEWRLIQKHLERIERMADVAEEYRREDQRQTREQWREKRRE
jgi:hypothetical protein